MASRARRWQIKRIAEGKCSVCGRTRDPTLTMRCRECQDKWNAYQRTYLRQMRVRQTQLDSLGED